MLESAMEELEYPFGVRRPPRAEELPYDDGEPLDTPKHFKQIVCLLQSLELAWKDRTDYYAGGNMFFYFSETQQKKNDFRGPDVFVVLDTNQRSRLSWVTWEEDGKRPDLIIELTSPTTSKIDHGAKKHLYARLGIPEYVIFDPLTGVFEGFTLDASGGTYVPLAPDARGLWPSRRLGLWLGVVPEAVKGVETGPWLRWFDAEGRMLLDPDEANVEAERAKADAERAKADAEARADALAAKIAELERQLGKA